MNLITVFSTTLLITTISTLILAVAAYFAYKLREWRKPKTSGAEKNRIDESFKPIFLKRHMLNDIAPYEHIDNS